MPVLIVDPEPYVRDLVSNVLRCAGLQALAVAAPHEALPFATREPRIDLLLAELTLPEMPGIELARQFLSLSPSTALMFMSGYAQQSLISGWGPLPLLAKPFTAPALISRVEEALGSSANGGWRLAPKLQRGAENNNGGQRRDVALNGRPHR